jgi:hypothetical protein
MTPQIGGLQLEEHSLRGHAWSDSYPGRIRRMVSISQPVRLPCKVSPAGKTGPRERRSDCSCYPRANARKRIERRWTSRQGEQEFRIEFVVVSVQILASKATRSWSEAEGIPYMPQIKLCSVFFLPDMQINHVFPSKTSL